MEYLKMAYNKEVGTNITIYLPLAEAVEVKVIAKDLKQSMRKLLNLGAKTAKANNADQ